ncbi:hypothetical protein GCM10010300_77640 [Streptomyces olivaceoviridis]|nr:hypothetical protein GCM10010300_77640 [Streptomyces olivaceoviridis]
MSLTGGKRNDVTLRGGGTETADTCGGVVRVGVVRTSRSAVLLLSAWERPCGVALAQGGVSRIFVIGVDVPSVAWRVVIGTTFESSSASRTPLGLS